MAIHYINRHFLTKLTPEAVARCWSSFLERCPLYEGPRRLEGEGCCYSWRIDS